MGFNLGGLGSIGDIVNKIKEGGVGELLQKLPLDQLPLDQLLSSPFLQKFTPFESIRDFLQSGGFSASTAEELKSLPQDKLNEHVSKTTSFSSLKDMLVKAAEFYAQRK
ncbi:hypothetical protein [Paenibacillus sp. S150]|uniref:hypothetical protein n=1 Tax=Paenibacillus sp. S150 TaxID=2749826 RepID=UPI001C55CA4A|nr:hypothetical protein [Paenibacillus sp. S150]MBW4080495.1 hypothetical protein [Paenibacillus sp. S150]